MTKTEIQSLIDTKLASGSSITASEHREVETAILNYIADTAPLLKGTIFVGDVNGDKNMTIYFSDLGTSNYIVTGSLVSNGNWDDDNEVFYVIKNKTNTSFDLLLNETSGVFQNLNFDYVIFKA